MHLLALPFTILEIVIFSIAFIAFLLAVRFVIASQKSMQHLLPTKKKKSGLGLALDRDGFVVPTGKQTRKAQEYEEQANVNETKQEIKELRDMVQLQQLELTRALRQIETIHTKKEESYFDEEYEEEPSYKTSQLQSSENSLLAEELKHQLQRKEAEVRELRQQVELNHQLQTHFEEVQKGYEELQDKVQKMEGHAWQAAEIAMKVDSLEQENEQLEKTLLKKEEKIRELSVENGRLHEMLNQTEDKLAEANLQRQQLNKKVQFLEEINSDIQQMSDANRKLRSELRRVAELESMLNLITEERDALLKRKVSRF